VSPPPRHRYNSTSHIICQIAIMAEKIFIDGVNFYQFAAVVEEEILNQDFPSADGNPIRMASRRTFNEAETAHRLEIGIGRSFIPPITLDCRGVSSDRLMVTPTCWTTSGCTGASHNRIFLLPNPQPPRQSPLKPRTRLHLPSLPGEWTVR